MARLCQYFVILMVFSFLVLTAKSEEDQVSVQIVFMAKSKDSAASHVETLASVLGSKAAAQKAIIYEYTRTLNGFAAKLTTNQINALLKQPAVLKILPGGIRNADISSTP